MSHLKRIAGQFDRDKFQELTSEMTFSEYVDLLYEKPKLTRTAYQMIYDMIMEKGSHEFEEYRKTYIHYDFFDDPDEPIIGIAKAKDELVKFIKGAAGCYGTERRVLLLHGPVGSSKSTICRLIKKSLEKYSKTDAGSWYSYKWINIPTEDAPGMDALYTRSTAVSPMHENPLKLLPMELRNPVLAELNGILREQTPEKERSSLYNLRCEGELNPFCKFFMKDLLKRYDGDLEKVLSEHICVVRKVYSEADRCGIATFQPKDEKNQDATELTGDINFSLISTFGSDSDPRAFNFDGEFCVANRGMIEFIEILKLEPAFLYDLLGATQEQSIKPKKFSQVSIDEAIIKSPPC